MCCMISENEVSNMEIFCMLDLVINYCALSLMVLKVYKTESHDLFKPFSMKKFCFNVKKCPRLMISCCIWSGIEVRHLIDSE
jgi:hypothetical protein